MAVPLRSESRYRSHRIGGTAAPYCSPGRRAREQLTRKALAEAVKPKVSYEVDVAALDGDDADLGDTVAVIDTSRDPEWRLTVRIVRRVRTFGEGVAARVTIGTVEAVDYAQVSALAADVAALQDDVVGIDGNLSTAASVTVVESTVTEAIDDLDELGDLEF